MADLATSKLCPPIASILPPYATTNTVVDHFDALFHPWVWEIKFFLFIIYFFIHSFIHS